MSFQAYIDNIKAKNGLSPDDFRRLAKKKGIKKSGTRNVKWVTGLMPSACRPRC